MTNVIKKIYKNGTEYDIYATGGAAGAGDVTGPSSATNGHLAVFDGTTGKLIKDGGAVPDISGKQNQHTALSVTLTSNGWSSNTQTVTATGVTASNTVIISPAPSSFSDYTSAVIYCSAQASNSLTFTCTTEPTSNITVNVAILD